MAAAVSMTYCDFLKLRSTARRMSLGQPDEERPSAVTASAHRTFPALIRRFHRLRRNENGKQSVNLRNLRMLFCPGARFAPLMRSVVVLRLARVAWPLVVSGILGALAQSHPLGLGISFFGVCRGISGYVGTSGGSR